MQHEDTIDTMIRRYERFMDFLRQQDPNGAAEEFARFCRWMRGGSLRLSNRTLAAFAEAWIDIFWQVRRHDMMLKVAEDAQAAFGDDPEWRFARGEALFNLARFEEARTELEQLTTEDFDDPMLYYLLGCLAERRGEEDEARRFFATANRLDPKEFALPVEIGEDEAIAIFENFITELPDPIAWCLKDVPVYVSPLPSDELLMSQTPSLDPLIMGLFMGQAVGEGESVWASDQPRILLFHKNIAKAAGDMDALEDEFRKTLFHEVGHYLGYDEDQLEEMGLA